MSRGLIVGTVYSADSDQPAADAQVALTRVVGNQGSEIAFSGIRGGRRQYSETVADSDGEFALMFRWSGVDFGSAMLYVSLHLIAYTEVTTRLSFRVTGSARVQARGEMFDDSPRRVLQLIPGYAPDAGMVEHAALLAASFHNLPVPSVDDLSTELKLILSGINIKLR